MRSKPRGRFPEKMLRARRCGSPRLPEPAVPSFPTALSGPFSARFNHETKLLSVVSFSPPSAPDLAGKGRRGPGAVEEGGSSPLFIYLFRAFLPQVAMVIPSSLSLPTRGDGHPSVNTPVCPGEAVPSLAAPHPGSGSSLRPAPAPLILAPLPALPSRRRSETGAAQTASSPCSSPLPRSEVLPTSGTAGRDAVPVPIPGAGGGGAAPAPSRRRQRRRFCPRA